MAATQRPAASQQQDGAGDTKSQSDGVAPAAPVNGKGKERKVAPPATPLEWAALSLLIFLTYFLMPHPLHAEGEPSIHHVFYYGWLTAVSTGLGVVPLILAPNLDSYWVGISNAIAAGMMSAASISLFWEGLSFTEPHDNSELSTQTRTGIGALLGLAFILGTKGILDRYEDLKVAGMDGADARKALLVFFVMTLHSFSEGVGIGVSFGGTHGSELGMFISASLAVHNVPEGLAMCAVLLPKGTSQVTAALWAVATSLPQPLMAVPAYLFVHHFIPIVPIGLGFAGGAMAWVAVFELLTEAIEDTDIITTGSVASLALAVMMFIVEKIEGSSKS